MEKILISACLLGENVRYDSGNCLVTHKIIQQWRIDGRLVPLCPEVAGGLSVPRPPCEKDLKTGQILTVDGQDCSDAFRAGAHVALNLVKKEEIRFALLKERSPSCGVNQIYDGTFSGTKITGMGITAQVLSENGVKVFSEDQLVDLQKALTGV